MLERNDLDSVPMFLERYHSLFKSEDKPIYMYLLRKFKVSDIDIYFDDQDNSINGNTNSKQMLYKDTSVTTESDYGNYSKAINASQMKTYHNFRKSEKPTDNNAKLAFERALETQNQLVLSKIIQFEGADLMIQHQILDQLYQISPDLLLKCLKFKTKVNRPKISVYRLIEGRVKSNGAASKSKQSCDFDEEEYVNASDVVETLIELKVSNDDIMDIISDIEIRSHLGKVK